MPCCGRPARRHGTNPPPPSEHIDPTAAVASAAGSARYLVVRNRQTENGKRFSTLDAAQDYARRTGGVIRQL